MRTLLHNAQIVLPNALIEQGWLLIEGERIRALGKGVVSPDDAERVIDAQQALLLPGLIDLHCDAIEKVVEPRPNVFFDINFALQQVDWRLAGSGITTEFHAVSLDDGEFSVRSDRFVYDLYAGLQAETDLLIRHKLHVRLELSSEHGLSVITRMIEKREPDMISLMDHSPGQGQYTSEQSFREYMARTSSRSVAVRLVSPSPPMTMIPWRRWSNGQPLASPSASSQPELKRPAVRTSWDSPSAWARPTLCVVAQAAAT